MKDKPTEEPIVQTEKYKVLNSEDQHDYNVIVTSNDGKITIDLWVSNHELWEPNYRNTLVQSLVDDGNNITFKKASKKVEYNEFSHLSILICVYRALEFEDQTESMTEFKIVREEVLLEI